jgi:hypothetical protein
MPHTDWFTSRQLCACRACQAIRHNAAYRRWFGCPSSGSDRACRRQAREQHEVYSIAMQQCISCTEQCWIGHGGWILADIASLELFSAKSHQVSKEYFPWASATCDVSVSRHFKRMKEHAAPVVDEGLEAAEGEPKPGEEEQRWTKHV